MFGLKDTLFAPEDDAMSGSTGLSDDVALMSEEEDEQTPPAADEEEEEVEVPSEEVEEEEETHEETDEKPKDEILPHERPTLTDIKAKFPDLFKTFPSLRDVIFRERAYTELFTSIADARAAQENSQSLEVARASIFDGDGSDFLKAIKEVDEGGLKKFAANILPQLYRIDKDAHWAAATPILENTVKSFYRAAGDNEEAKKAAESLAKFLFGDDAQEVLSGKKTFIPAASEKKVDPERVKFETERATAFTSDVDTFSEKNLKSLILSKDKNGNLRLDPDGTLSDYMKDMLTERILIEVNKQMAVDKAHMNYMDDLWRKAAKSGFTSEWKSRITNAYLARARQLVPAVRTKVVSDATGMKIRVATKTRTTVEKSEQNRNAPARVNKGGNGPLNPKSIDYSKTSDEDILNDNVTFRR